MKFEIGQMVKIKTSGMMAEVRAYKHEITYTSGKIAETFRYFIKSSRGNFLWFNEDELMHDDQYQFSKQFEIGLLDTLIDINLSVGNYELVKQYNKQKQQLIGGKQ